MEEVRGLVSTLKTKQECPTPLPVSLYPYQEQAVNKLKNGSILCGGVGSGKSRTSLAYWWTRGQLPLYIITTARKRDTKEWDAEVANYTDSLEYHVDSWNNIGKYIDIHDAFFIFDEQRVVGKGAWVKSFLKIVKTNEWILLSATPGDTWMDYVPVFLANGFYKNRTAFEREHVIWDRYCRNYPKINGYMGTKKLEAYRSSILVDMDYKRPTVTKHIDILVDFDQAAYKNLYKTRWDNELGVPIETASMLCYKLREIVHSDPSRIKKAYELAEAARKAIIFYNYNYELDILREAFKGWVVGEWNGQKHEPVPDGDQWVYLVQYTAGAEGWNCVKTDTIIFYSLNYSYKIMTQAAGRTDRLNTPYKELYYYKLRSRAPIDLAVAKAIEEKKLFNKKAFTGMEKG